jgi:hypothetical protein
LESELTVFGLFLGGIFPKEIIPELSEAVAAAAEFDLTIAAWLLLIRATALHKSVKMPLVAESVMVSIADSAFSHKEVTDAMLTLISSIFSCDIVGTACDCVPAMARA